MRWKHTLAAIGLLFGFYLCAGCEAGKYDKLPQTSDKETKMLGNRFQSLIDEAKQIKGTSPYKLLHHFSDAALSVVSPANFTKMANQFVSAVTADEYAEIEFVGGRAPSKIRILLFETPKIKGAVPLVKSVDGWRIDDVEIAFGKFDKEINQKGNRFASSPSALASLVVLEDKHASEQDIIEAALGLSELDDLATIKSFAKSESRPWAKTALLYASWKNGQNCQAFSTSFPIGTSQQNDMYNNNSDAFRTLLQGLFGCAKEQKALTPIIKIYRACYKAESGPRSEYVEPLLDLANAKPAQFLIAAIKAKYPYEQDPAANIVVNGLHGEKKPFNKYLYKKRKAKGKLGKLAKLWLEKMSARDAVEPPGTHDQ
jgi:hypothetical protein